MLGIGLWWLNREEARARARGEGFGDGQPATARDLASDEKLRERATSAREFDPAEIDSGKQASSPPSILLAALPLIVVIVVNILMSFFILPRVNADYLSQPQFGATSLSALSGVWAVITALATAIVVALAINLRRLPALKSTIDAGANASVLPIMSVASLVGFGAVVAAMPAFRDVSDWVLGIGGGPLVASPSRSMRWAAPSWNAPRQSEWIPRSCTGWPSSVPERSTVCRTMVRW